MSSETKSNIKMAGIIFLVILVLIFTIQNIEMVTVTFLWYEVSMSRAVLVVALLIIGFILGKLSRMKAKVQKSKIHKDS